jgi:hypothetical protein
MTDFDYRLDDTNALVDPAVGDAEIRGIQFDHPNMQLHIVQPFDGRHIDVLLSDLIFLDFRTDHPQNVIGNVFIYRNWQSARFPPGSNIDEHARKSFDARGQYILVVDGITGGPLVCGARDLTIRVRSAQS